MLQKKNSKYRFSILQPLSGQNRQAQRRMTVFNPIDPNNSQAAFRFLAKNGSRAMILKDGQSAVENMANNSYIDESVAIVGEI
jgi:hypothetical protein